MNLLQDFLNTGYILFKGHAYIFRACTFLPCGNGRTDGLILIIEKLHFQKSLITFSIEIFSLESVITVILGLSREGRCWDFTRGGVERELH